MKLKKGIIAILLVIALLAFVPAVSAVTTFTPRGYAATASAPNGGSCSNTSNAWVYSGDTIHYATTSEVYTVWKGYCTGSNFVTAGTYRANIATGQTGDVMLNYTSGISSSYITGIMFDSPFGARATYLFPYTNQSAPTLNYANFTINVKSNTTGLNVPRVDVNLRSSSTSTIDGKTDLEGNITFGLVGVWSNFQPIITASKAGYNTTSITIIDNLNTTPEIYRSIPLNDVPSLPGAAATVYLDIADSKTGSAINGATVGIQNTTATIDPWTYAIYPESTIVFNKTGIYKLSAGQTVVFSGYKSGLYIANNTGNYVIPSAISHTTLLLDPVTSADESLYNITLTPNKIGFGGYSSGLLTYPAGDPSAVRWYAWYPGQTKPSDFYDATSTPNSQKHLNYALLNGSWMGWDTETSSFSNNKGSMFPNPVTLIPRYSGNFTVGCMVFGSDGTLIANPTTVITVGASQSLQKITFLAEDALSGDLISPTEFNIKNLLTNAWSNQSEIRVGQVDVEYSAGTLLYVEAVPPSQSGYSKGILTYQIQDTTGWSQSKVIPLWKNESTDINLTTANLIVNKNSDFNPIQGAKITLSDGQICTTPASGNCQMTLNNGTYYTASVTATGYKSNQFGFVPIGASYSKVFQLVAIGTTPTPDITVPIPGATGTAAPAGIVTLDPTSRNKNVQDAGDIWFAGAVGLSALIFLAVLCTVVGKIKLGKK